MTAGRNERDYLDRIEINEAVLVGKPVIKGTRLSVEFVLGLLAHGMTTQDLIAEYPGLVQEDILACLSFAAQAMGDSVFLNLETGAA
jgi:uncharacterized protein (DUF433 family)